MVCDKLHNGKHRECVGISSCLNNPVQVSQIIILGLVAAAVGVYSDVTPAAAALTAYVIVSLSVGHPMSRLNIAPASTVPVAGRVIGNVCCPRLLAAASRFEAGASRCMRHCRGGHRAVSVGVFRQ